MPIKFDMEQVRKKHGCDIYLETGLWDPRTDISCKYALKCNFDKVYSIEIRNDWVDIGKNIFHDYIRNGSLHLINDDSTNLAKYIVNNPDFNRKTMFFLDAHVDNTNIHNFRKNCPLVEELDAIRQLSRKDHLIMIDDVRILAQPFPWGETSHGDANFLHIIVDLIHKINQNYQFTFFDGVVKNDVLVAYI